MLDWAAFIQAQLPALNGYDTVALLVYMLYNEARFRRGGNGNGNGSSKSETSISDKLSALAIQNSGLIIRVDAQEKNFEDERRTSSGHRRELREELRSLTTRVTRLEERREHDT